MHQLFKPVLRDGARRDGLAAGGLLGELRYVEVAVDREQQRARDRRRGHDENIGIAGAGLLLKRKPLGNAEAVLLVHDGEAQA